MHVIQFICFDLMESSFPVDTALFIKYELQNNVIFTYVIYSRMRKIALSYPQALLVSYSLPSQYFANMNGKRL